MSDIDMIMRDQTPSPKHPNLKAALATAGTAALFVAAGVGLWLTTDRSIASAANIASAFVLMGSVGALAVADAMNQAVKADLRRLDALLNRIRKDLQP